MDNAHPGRDTEVESAPDSGSPPEMDMVRWRVLDKLVQKGDGGAVARILCQSPQGPSANEFVYWAKLCLPRFPQAAHLLADCALEIDVTSPSAHVIKAHAFLTAGDRSTASEHYGMAKGIDPSIHDPAFESEGSSPVQFLPTTGAASPATSTPVQLNQEYYQRPEPPPPARGQSGRLTLPVAAVAHPNPDFDSSFEGEDDWDESEEYDFGDEPELDEPAESSITSDLADAAAPVGPAPELPAGPKVDSSVGTEAKKVGEAESHVAETKGAGHSLAPVSFVAPPAPLIDPTSVPKPHALSFQRPNSNPASLQFGSQSPEPPRSLAIPKILARVAAEDGAEPIETLELIAGEEGEDEHDLAPVILVAEGGPVPKPTEKSDAKERLSAALSTILVHAAVAILLAVIIINLPKEEPPEITAVTLSPTDTDSPKRQLARAIRGNPSPPSQSSMALIAADTVSPIAAPTVEIVPPNDSLDLGTTFGTGAGFGAGLGRGGAFGVPSAMRSRCSPTERSKKLAQHGGPPQSEFNVQRALAWIASQQNEDGSWGKKYKCAMTGLALLSFLGHCETPDSRKYGDTVMKGILYLVEVSQTKDIYATAGGHSAAYEHGIATYALGECYAIARLGKRKLPGMREAFSKGTEKIINGQNPDGGWSYGYPARGSSDTSVTGWQYQALKAAKHTKLSIDGLDKAIENCQNYLYDNQDRNSGGFPYRPGQFPKKSLTAAGVLGMQMLGGTTKYADNIEHGLRYALEDLHEESWENANAYTWYYNTQACFQYGGNPWTHWNKMFSDALMKNQNPDGSWDGAAGSHANEDAKFYVTCLSVLMLEVYYRYLPAAG